MDNLEKPKTRVLQLPHYVNNFWQPTLTHIPASFTGELGKSNLQFFHGKNWHKLRVTVIFSADVCLRCFKNRLLRINSLLIKLLKSGDIRFCTYDF